MIADDHVLVRKGIRALLGTQADFQLVAEAGSYGEAVEQLYSHKPDVVMLDIAMPGRDGLDLVAYVRSVQPQARIIVLTMHTEDEYASRALKAGTHGYVTKDSTPDQLVSAIRRVASGSSFLSPRIAESLALRLTRHDDAPLHTRLSRREFAIFGMLVEGRTVTAIAQELALSVKTVSAHKMRVLRKMNLRSQSDLVRYAIQHRVAAS
jgi:DNA-binding NarL/FixJ family response regulator